MHNIDAISGGVTVLSNVSKNNLFSKFLQINYQLNNSTLKQKIAKKQINPEIYENTDTNGKKNTSVVSEENFDITSIFGKIEYDLMNVRYYKKFYFENYSNIRNYAPIMEMHLFDKIEQQNIINPNEIEFEDLNFYFISELDDYSIKIFYHLEGTIPKIPNSNGEKQNLKLLNLDIKRATKFNINLKMKYKTPLKISSSFNNQQSNSFIICCSKISFSDLIIDTDFNMILKTFKIVFAGVVYIIPVLLNIE